LKGGQNMGDFISWNSQPLEDWANKYAKGKFIDLGGRNTYYIEKGEGEAIILLHGFFYDSYLWDSNIEVLAEHFKVYALDLWGFGYSTREPLDYGYQLYSDQVLMFMDALNIKQASLAGQSMGGGTAIYFCLKHRQRVNKLILVDAAGVPHGLPLTGKFFNLPGVGEFFLGLNNNLIRRKNLADVFIHNKNLITDNYFENVTRFHKIKDTTECMLTILRKQFFHTLSNQLRQLSQLDVPILIIWGKEDKAIPWQKGEEMHKILKGSRFEILESAGHVPNYECAEEFNKLALDFLQEMNSR
jgi:pimeloyl-ACP methyl ester carboxylesterase